jgi:uncharacterized protein YggE
MISRTNVATWITIVVLVAGVARAQTLQTEPPSIQVTATATMSANPDAALIELGLTTNAASVEQASAANRTKMNAVLTELRKVLEPSAEIKTSNYSVHPQYTEPKPGEAPKIAGYTVSNVVRVKTAQLDDVGKLIDVAMRSGANTIQRLEFVLENDQGARAQALEKAARDARAKGDTLARSLSVRIVRVLSAREDHQPPVQPYAAQRMVIESMTPAEPRTIEVHATVSLTMEVAQ